MAEFLRVYADERHHHREEALFFPVLVKYGVPAQGCPIGGLSYEHEKGRILVSALVEQISCYERQQSGSTLRETLFDINKLYRHHLWMEDSMVFPMAEKLISGDDNRELMEKFAELDRNIGPEAIARLEQFAGSLSFQVGTIGPGYSCS